MVAKVLSNRFKIVLPITTSPNQSTFVLERLISDNIVIAYEVLHSMTSRFKGKARYVVLKLDMSEAYDQIE